MAYINFDTSIEVSISVFMYSNTKPKGNCLYGKKEFNETDSYFKKLETFETYIKNKKYPIKWTAEYINYYHEKRNQLYHDPLLASSDSSELNEIRQIAFWVFSMLFKENGIENLLNSYIVESEKDFPQIPVEFVKPSIIGIHPDNETSLFLASILGGWNENSNDDIDIIKEIVPDFGKWMDDIREIKKYNDEIILLRYGHWQVTDKFNNLLKYSSFFYDYLLNIIKTISLKVLSEVNPMFELNPENRFAANIYGKIPKYSQELRKGLCETLVFLDIHGEKLKNCTRYKIDEIGLLTIRELFQDADWELWASLNDILPILAEVAPREFLSSVENALKQSPCPFSELFNQEGKGGIIGANYLTGLLWALENLAWSDEYISRSILALANLAANDPGGSWANRPGNSITTILMPWMPQTMASVENRIVALKGIQRNYPEIAWKTLNKLLPYQNQVSVGSHKPSFRNFIPEDWENSVSDSDYWNQVESYAGIVVEMAKGNIIYISKLVENLDNIPQPHFNTFLKYLSSSEITELTEVQKQSIWEALLRFTIKHRSFPNAKWALPSETIDLLEQTAIKIEPTDPNILHKHLFSNNFYNVLRQTIDWHEQQEQIQKQKIEAINQIYEKNGIDSIISFAENVANPAEVGSFFAHIANAENDGQLLPSFLDSNEQFKKDFIGGYIWSRYHIKGINWIDLVNPETLSLEQKRIFFFNLPFEEEIWQKADHFLGKEIEVYWKFIIFNPYQTKSNLHPAITNLLHYNRPWAALNCIYTHHFLKKEFFRDEAIKALIDGISTEESLSEMKSDQIVEIIQILQDDTQINEGDLLKIEWGYLSLLNIHNSVKPILLEKYLSQKTNLFIEVIQLLYHSKKNIGEQEIDENRKNSALNAWQLLRNWKQPPGMLDDGSFSDKELRRWYDEVKAKTIESGHFEVAMTHLGHVLYHAGSDPNGLWIQQSVAELLDEYDNADIRKGFVSEVYNSRGAYWVDPSGNVEIEIAKKWKTNADDVEKIGLVRFASALKDVALSYEREAKRVISDSATENDFYREE